VIFFLYGSEREKEQQYGLGRRRKVDYRTKLYCNVKKGLQEQCVSPVRLEDEVAVCEPLQQHIPEMFIKGESMSITSNNSTESMQVEMLRTYPSIADSNNLKDTRQERKLLDGLRAQEEHVFNLTYLHTNED